MFDYSSIEPLLEGTSKLVPIVDFDDFEKYFLELDCLNCVDTRHCSMVAYDRVLECSGMS